MEYEIYVRREGYSTDTMLYRENAETPLEAIVKFVREQLDDEMVVANGEYHMITAVKVTA